MKRKRYASYLFISVLSLALLTGCPGLADYDVDLPGDYSVIRTSAHEVKIAPLIGEGHWGGDVIPTKVIEVAWDEKYILAKQLDLKDDPKSSNGYQIPDTRSVHYWILEYKTGDVTGPLDKREFEKKRIEFQIAEDVILRNVSEMVK